MMKSVLVKLMLVAMALQVTAIRHQEDDHDDEKQGRSTVALAMATVPTQAKMLENFGPLLKETGSTYRKTGVAFMKPGKAGQVLETFIDGKLETTRTLDAGDMIIRADTVAKERYSISADTFSKRYKRKPVEIDDNHVDAAELKAEGFQAFEPTGRCIALQVDEQMLEKLGIVTEENGIDVPGGEFLASWGSPMLVEPGDFLCAPAPAGETGNPEVISEVYRIEQKAMKQTYAIEEQTYAIED